MSQIDSILTVNNCSNCRKFGITNDTYYYLSAALLAIPTINITAVQKLNTIFIDIKTISFNGLQILCNKKLKAWAIFLILLLKM